MKIASLMLLAVVAVSHVGATSKSGGLTLLESASARSSALGEAFTAVQDDITAFHYNPSALPSLLYTQASIFHREGLEEDSYNLLMLGIPRQEYGLGFSVGYYDGGDIELYDGVSRQNIEGPRDLVVSMGVGRGFGPLLLGLSGKYISSQIIDSVQAQAYAFDFGFNYVLHSRLRWGGAMQNMGTKLEFDKDGDQLPRLVRSGLEYALLTKSIQTSVMLDSNYLLIDRELGFGVGLENRIGPISLRTGYKDQQDLDEFTLGTGVGFGRSSLDYAVGLIQGLDAQHRISFSKRFGGPSAAFFTSNEKDHKKPVIMSDSKNAYQARVYRVKKGDTWESISQKFYRSENMQSKIRTANQHLINSSNQLIEGQLILVP